MQVIIGRTIILLFAAFLVHSAENDSGKGVFQARDRIITVFLQDNNWPDGLVGSFCSLYYYEKLRRKFDEDDVRFLKSLFMLRPNCLEYDLDRSLSILEDLTKKGDVPSKLVLGRLFLGQIPHVDVEVDLPKGRSLLEEAHLSGSMHAAAFLGMHFFRQKDYATAVQWYEAGQQLNSPANSFLGYMLERRVGGNDEDALAKLLRHAASKGYLPALLYMGMASTDDGQRLAWLNRAMEMGYRPAGLAMLSQESTDMIDAAANHYHEFIGTADELVFLRLLEKSAFQDAFGPEMEARLRELSDQGDR